MATMALAIAALTGCGGGVPRSLAPPNTPTTTMKLDANHPAFLRGNEHFRASVALLGISAGELDATISEICDARGQPKSAVMLTTMRTSGVVRWIIRRDGNVSTRLDPITAIPVEQTMEVHDGGPVRDYRLTFSPGRLDYVFQKGDEPKQTGLRVVPNGKTAFDIQSAVVLLRSWRPEPGAIGRFDIALGRGIWQVEVAYRGATKIKIDDRERRAVWIEGVAREVPRKGHKTASPRRLRIWFSDDDDRVPLRISADADYGSAEFTLDSHERTADGCSHR